MLERKDCPHAAESIHSSHSAHQPCGNFEHVAGSRTTTSYLHQWHLESIRSPSRPSTIRALLTWIEDHRLSIFVRLKSMRPSGQGELVGGASTNRSWSRFCREISANRSPGPGRLSREALRPGSLRRLACRARLGTPASHALAQRKRLLTRFVDDIHFLSAGFEPEELFGAYIAEDRGRTVWLYPGQKALRYLIPFGKSETSSPICAMLPASTPAACRHGR